MIPAAALVIGLLLGWACGGNIQGLKDITWSGWRLTLSLFVVQALARGRLFGVSGWSRIGAAVWVCCSLVLVGLLIRKSKSPGIFVASVGILLNVVVVILNGGMPVGAPPSGSQLVMAALGEGQRAFYQPVGQQSLWSMFGDILPVRLFGSWTMLSVGDVLLMIGVLVWVVGVMAVDPLRRDAR